MTLHLTGLPAFVALLVLCTVACSSVWLLSLWVRDLAMRRLERRYRRKMAALGVAPAEIDAGWRRACGEANP